jgi:hypothetical protein
LVVIPVAVIAAVAIIVLVVIPSVIRTVIAGADPATILAVIAIHGDVVPTVVLAGHFVVVAVRFRAVVPAGILGVLIIPRVFLRVLRATSGADTT